MTPLDAWDQWVDTTSNSWTTTNDKWTTYASLTSLNITSCQTSTVGMTHQNYVSIPIDSIKSLKISHNGTGATTYRGTAKYPKHIPARALDVVMDEIDRRPPPKEFNRYINASDLLEEFIRYVGSEGVRQREVLELPVELFVKWLVIRACEEDHEEPEVTLEIPAPARQPRCMGCQKFMRRGTDFPLHGQRCAKHLFARRPELVS